jgi:hypothetical protein
MWPGTWVFIMGMALIGFLPVDREREPHSISERGSVKTY